MLLQDIKLQEWYQGKLQGFTKKEAKKELGSLSIWGHGVYDLVPIRLISPGEQSKIIESRRVIGPGSGPSSVLMARHSLDSLERASLKSSTKSLSMLIHLRRRCSSSFSWWVRSTSGSCSFRCCSAFLTPVDESKGLIFVQAPQDTQHPEPIVWELRCQLYGLRDSPRSWQIYLTQVLQQMNLVQMKSDPCSFIGRDSSSKLSILAMAYVDDLIISGEKETVQNFFQEIPKVFSLKHMDYLTADHSRKLLGRIIQKRRSGQITMELSQKFIDNVLVFLTSLAKSLLIESRFIP